MSHGESEAVLVVKGFPVQFGDNVPVQELMCLLCVPSRQGIPGRG